MATTDETSRTWVGSRNYIAPEVFTFAENDTKATDIFSAGIILYIMVNGHFPFKEANATC